MKRLEFLIRDIKSMSNIGGGSYSSELLTTYFNEAQNIIRRTIFLANNEANILKGRYYIDVDASVREFELPSRVFAVNSILTVGALDPTSTEQEYSALRFLNYKNYQNEYGYTLLNNNLLLSTRVGGSQIRSLEVVYNSLLPSLGIRSGLVTAISGNTITLDGATADTELTDKTDQLTFVDSTGSVIKSDVVLVSQAGPSIVVGDSTDIVVGNYLVIGGYSTTNSVLPIECEDYLRKYVERRVAIGDSAMTDTTTTNLLTEEEKAEIASLFAKSLDDVIYPVIAPETTWL